MCVLGLPVVASIFSSNMQLKILNPTRSITGVNNGRRTESCLDVLR